MAALLASLPSTTSWASITCHWRAIPFLEGNSVFIDTLLQLVYPCKIFSLRVDGAGCQIALFGRFAGRRHDPLGAHVDHQVSVVLQVVRRVEPEHAKLVALASEGFDQFCGACVGQRIVGAGAVS